MQEPQIFEQPVGSKDPEAVPGAGGDDGNPYYAAYQNAYQVGNAAEELSLEEDYHDFVYPEGNYAYMTSPAYGGPPPIGGGGTYLWDASHEKMLASRFMLRSLPVLTMTQRQKVGDMVDGLSHHQPRRRRRHLLDAGRDHPPHQQRRRDVTLLGTGRRHDILVSITVMGIRRIFADVFTWLKAGMAVKSQFKSELQGPC